MAAQPQPRILPKLLGLQLLLWAAFADAAELTKPPSIAVVVSKDLPQYEQVLDGFKSRLGGKVTLRVLSLEAMGQDALAAELGALAPRAIFAIGPGAAKAVRATTSDTPLVYAAIPDPEALGLTGPSVTGVLAHVHPKKYLALLRALGSGIKRVGIIYHSDKSRDYLAEAGRAAAAAGMQLVMKKADSEQDVPKLLRELIEDIDAFWVIPDASVASRGSYRFIVRNTAEKALPLLAFSGELVKAGATLGLTADFGDAGDKAALMIEKIIAGTRAESIPAAYPDGRLEMNDEVAARMSLRIPEDVRGRRGKIY